MAPSKTSGLGDRFFVNGFDLSGDTNSFSRIGGGNTPILMTDITQFAQARQGGLLGGEINWTSYFDAGVGQAHPVLSALPRTSSIISYFHQPTAVGAHCASMVAKQIGYDPTRAASGALTLGVASQNSDGYPLEWGLGLTAGTRTDVAATNGASIDNGASTAFGAQAYLHVFAVTGTSVTVTLQDSPDNTTFTNIASGAFVAATTAGAQRIALPAGATVNRYVRAITSGTFTNAQFAVNFIRNLTVVAY